MCTHNKRAVICCHISGKHSITTDLTRVTENQTDRVLIFC